MAITAGLAAVGSALDSGRGFLLDAGLAIVVGWIAIALLAGFFLLVGKVLRGIPSRLRAMAVAATVVLGIFLYLVSPAGPLVVAVFLMAGALAGAGIASLGPTFRRRRGRVATVVGLVVGVLGLGVVPMWFADGGGDPPAQVLAPGGPHGFTTLTYGSGDHPYRVEFGADVDVITPTVDGTDFLQSWSGWGGSMRSGYWGFGPDQLPLNGRIWLPDSGLPGPLVLVAHGNHAMEEPSDLGYTWLAEELASRGYVVASVDQNFLNLSVTRGLDLGEENDARAWLLLEHLRLWRTWDSSSPLHGVADLGRIALIGHSRGGEAAAHAAHFDTLERYPEDATVAFDAGFGIDAVVAIAPIDGQYEPAGRRTTLTDISYLTLQGGRDGDIASFDGLRQYERTTFTGDPFAAKAAIFLEDANHGQFNTVWGRRDAPGIIGRALETADLMPGDAQRRDARTAIVAFLDGTLDTDRSGLSVLQDGNNSAWSGETRIITRYADSTETLIAGFDEDSDPATGTLPGARLEGSGLSIWREGPAPLRWGDHVTNGVVLGWAADESEEFPTYTLSLPDDFAVTTESVLTMDLADPGNTVTDLGRGPEPPNFTVEFVTSDGETLATTIAAHGGIPEAPRPRRVKSPLPDPVPATEAIAQTVQIPIDFGSDVTARVAEIRFVFDQSPEGVVRIDRVALRSEPNW